MLRVIDGSVTHNGVVFDKGDFIEDISAADAERLIELNVCEEAEPEMVTGHLDPAQLHELKVDDLRKLAAEMGLETDGKKDELIARISAAEVEAPVEE